MAAPSQEFVDSVMRSIEENRRRQESSLSTMYEECSCEWCCTGDPNRFNPLPQAVLCRLCGIEDCDCDHQN